MNIPLYAGLLLAGVWVWHSVAGAVGMRKVPDISKPAFDPADNPAWPRVSIIVPAKDEAESIEQAARSLLTIEYPNLEVIAINDRSNDPTGAILDRIASDRAGCLRVLHIESLPAGWLGKTHAMHVGASKAEGEWLLFTDADVMHRPDALRRAVAYAERERADHLVLLPTVLMYTWGERLLVSFFQSLFIFAHRPWKVADPKAKDSIGVGAFNLVRRSAYEAIGGHARLRLAVVDDMRLGEEIKRHGFAQRVVFGHDLIRVRWAQGALGVVDNLTKNVFAEMKYNTALALFATTTLAMMHLGPWIGTFAATGWTRVPYAVALSSMLWSYAQSARRSGVSMGYAALHPVAAVMLTYTFLRSIAVTLRQGGVVWRGTKYSLDELRGS